MSDNKSKSKLYQEIALKKEFFRAYKKDDGTFDVKFPKKALLKIFKLYGDERYIPNSFISYIIHYESTKFQRLKTMSKEINDQEADLILETLEHYLIIPKSLSSQGLDEEQMSESAIKLKGTIIKDIFKMAGYNLDSLFEYAHFNIISQEVEHSTKTHISYYIYENIFKYVPLLRVYFQNDENFNIAFYSYRNILNKVGIKLEEMNHYLRTKIKEINREELMKEKIPLYESSIRRQLKGKINEEIREHKMYILKGSNNCHRYPTIPYDEFELNRNEESTLLLDLIEKIDKKKKDIKKIYDNQDNYIIEVKDTNNKIYYIRKILLNKIISSPDSDFDEYKTNDIDNNEIIISKKLLKENKNPPLIKIYNKNKKEEYIYIPKKDLEDNFNKFKYFKQENNFKGKNKNREPSEIKYILMDVESDNLPKLDESQTLYSIPGEDALYDKTKNDLLNIINKDNKNILICEKNNNYIPLETINQIKERDKNSKNKNIKYKIKNIINKELIIIEYKDIFDNELPADYILINDKDSPNDKVIVNKNDLVNELNGWDNLKKNIKIKNKINNNEIEINPSKIIVITPKKEEIPQNYENIQNEIKEKIKPEEIIIKTNNHFIKKNVVKKIIDDKEDYDIYYIKDIYSKKIKVSKKQLIKDNDDESCQYIIVNLEEEPDKDIIVLSKEILTKLEENPMEEEITMTDNENKNIKIKKTKIKIKPQEIEEITFEEQPEKIKKDLIKDIKDYYYLYIGKDNKPHYIRGDILNLIKNYKSNNPIDNFEVEDYKGDKIIIPKEQAIKIIDNNNEPKYICLDDEETKGEPIIAEYTILEKMENDIDEPVQINKEGKKIKLKNVKLTKIKEIKTLGEQPEEQKFDKLNVLIKNVQKKEPSSDIVQVKDSKGNNILIYEETLNKIEENKEDPEKTTYKGKNPLKEEVICGKNPNKVSPNIYIKLVEPSIIVDKNDLEKSLKEYKPKKKLVKIKDIKGNNSEFDPLNINIYKASSEETDVVKILPADFSDINQKLLIDIVPQNKLILSKDLNNKDIIIKKKAGENLVKYPKKDFDEYILFDKDGKKIKISRKKIENDNDNKNCEFIEIKDNSNNKDEIVFVNELVEALKDKENEEFEIKNKEGKKIKLNKKNIQIIKQDNKYIDIIEQGPEIKKKLLSDMKDIFIKVKDSKTNKDTILRNSQLNEVINHNQKAPFINYELINPKKEIVYITKDLSKEVISKPNNKLILCYDETQKDKAFLVPLENIKNAKCDGADHFDIGDGKKIIFKNLRIKQLEKEPEMGPQPEEEKMIKVLTLINKIKSGPLNKNYKTKNSEGNICFVSNNYINKLQNESKGDENDTKYKINDSFGKNKIILNKEILNKDNKPGEFIIIKSKNNNQNYLVDLNELINNLNLFKSTDNDINITNSLNNEKIKLDPLNIEIIPPYNDFPVEKIKTIKNIPIKIEENENEKKDVINIKVEDNKDKEKIEENKNVDIKTRLRNMPQRHQVPEKKIYKIRRAIIYRRQRKESQ